MTDDLENKRELSYTTKLTRTQSEPTDLRQGYVVRQVASPYSV